MTNDLTVFKSGKVDQFLASAVIAGAFLFRDYLNLRLLAQSGIHCV